MFKKCFKFIIGAVAILLPLLIVLILYCDIYIITNDITPKELLTPLLSYYSGCFVFFIAYYEYDLKVQREKAVILNDFNKRYLSDCSINKCICYFIDVEEHKEPEGRYIPDTRNREEFLRFFEELQLQIEAGALDEGSTHTLFGYYAGEADRLGKEFVDDYDKDCWKTFRRFAEKQKTHRVK